MSLPTPLPASLRLALSRERLRLAAAERHPATDPLTSSLGRYAVQHPEALACVAAALIGAWVFVKPWRAAMQEGAAAVAASLLAGESLTSVAEALWSRLQAATRPPA